MKSGVGLEKMSNSFTWILPLLMTLLLAGCGGGGDNGNDAPKPVPGEAVIMGRAVIEGKALEGGVVSIEDASGVTVPLKAPSTVDAAGMFVANLTALPQRSYTVHVTMPVDIFATVKGFKAETLTIPKGAVFSAEQEKLTGNKVMHLNLLTTLCKAYRKLNPDAGISEARTRLLDFIQVPASYRNPDELLHPDYSRFSSLVFIKNAQKSSMGLRDYINGFAKLVHSGKPVSVPTPLINWEQYFFQEINVRIEMVQKPAVKLTEDAAKQFSGGALAKALVSNVIGAVIKVATAIKDYEQKQALINALVDIENMLKQIITQLQVMLDWISQRFDVSDYTNLSNQIVGDMNTIKTAYGNIHNASVYASSDPPDTTDLDTQLQAIYTQYTLDGIFNNGQNIFARQWGKDPLSGNMMSLARTILGADRFLGDQIQGDLRQQMYTYLGYQGQAGAIITTLGQPALISNAAQPYVVQYSFSGNAAGNMNKASGYYQKITNDIQRQMSFIPKPLLDPAHIYDVKYRIVYQNAAVTSGSGGDKARYASGLTSGGLTNWQVADPATVKNLIPVEGIDALKAKGFNLQPGPVTYHQINYSCPTYGKCNWLDQGNKTATNSGFVVVDISASEIDVYWIDGKGNSGKIGYCHLTSDPKYDINACTDRDLAKALDSDHDFFIKESGGRWGEEVDCAGKINGPMIIINRLDTKNFTQPAAAVATAKYSGITIDGSAPWTADRNSGGASGTQQLKAMPIAVSGGPSVDGQDLTSDVLWEAWDPSDPTNSTPIDPTVATVSNIQVPDNPPATSPDFPPVPHKIGAIHWLPGSLGKSVTFTASRYLPDGTRIVGQITLASPVTRGTAQPDAIDVFPSVVQTTGSYLASTGFQIHTTRHWPRGWFEDASEKVVYTSSDNRVTVSGGGFVSLAPGASLPSGTVVTITATDDSAVIRPKDTCAININ